MAGSDDRQQQRYRVHLSVRFETALEFVTEYAENLSRGGLFVRGAHNLELNAEIPIRMEIPGYEDFPVVAKVVHVITPAMAEAIGRKPGAGFQISKGPKGFLQALRDYLSKLGRRRDVTVFASDEKIGGVLEGAGYQVQVVPEAHRVIAAMTTVKAPLIGLVATRDVLDHYAAVAASVGMTESVYGIDHLEEIDELFSKLDKQL
ncbi:MAG: PilZ domain-containing protein [bacterium]